MDCLCNDLFVIFCFLKSFENSVAELLLFVYCIIYLVFCQELFCLLTNLFMSCKKHNISTAQSLVYMLLTRLSSLFDVVFLQHSVYQKIEINRHGQPKTIAIRSDPMIKKTWENHKVSRRWLEF